MQRCSVAGSSKRQERKMEEETHALLLCCCVEICCVCLTVVVVVLSHAALPLFSQWVIDLRKFLDLRYFWCNSVVQEHRFDIFMIIRHVVY